MSQLWTLRRHREKMESMQPSIPHLKTVREAVEWLAANLGDYGFFRPYRTDRGGVSPEPWHLSYAPLSVPTLQALTLDVLAEAVEGSDIEGREHVLAQLPDIYDRYVVSIDSP